MEQGEGNSKIEDGLQSHLKKMDFPRTFKMIIAYVVSLARKMREIRKL